MENKELNMFSKRLKQLRVELNLTQKEFSDKIDLTASALSAYENNIKNPSIIVAKRIAQAFGISIDWLCGLTERRINNESLKTYSDIIETLSKISKAINTDIDFMTTNHFIREDGHFCIVFKDKTIQIFLENWSKMLSLFNDGTIDEGLYNLWLNDQKEKYNFRVGTDEHDLINKDFKSLTPEEQDALETSLYFEKHPGPPDPIDKK